MWECEPTRVQLSRVDTIQKCVMDSPVTFSHSLLTTCSRREKHCRGCSARTCGVVGLWCRVALFSCLSSCSESSSSRCWARASTCLCKVLCYVGCNTTLTATPAQGVVVRTPEDQVWRAPGCPHGPAGVTYMGPGPLMFSIQNDAWHVMGLRAGPVLSR